MPEFAVTPMNTYYPDPVETPEEIPALPAGEMPDVDQLPATEPSGPPAGTTNPFVAPAQICAAFVVSQIG